MCFWGVALVVVGGIRVFDGPGGYAMKTLALSVFMLALVSGFTMAGAVAIGWEPDTDGAVTEAGSADGERHVSAVGSEVSSR
jgi:hypothetical protein